VTIIRTPTRATGGITPQEKIKLDAVSSEWIGIAMSTDTCDRTKLTTAIHDLYAAANLKKPRVVIVPSPLVMAFAGGAASAIWCDRKNTDGATRVTASGATSVATSGATRVATFGATDDATDVATDGATRVATSGATRVTASVATDGATDDATDGATSGATRVATSGATSVATFVTASVATDGATDDATDGATSGATRGATSDATSVATFDATRGATDGATFGATSVATDGATRVATDGATRVATRVATFGATDGATRGAAQACFDLAGNFGIECAKKWHRTYQGGAYWAGQCSFLCGMRDVIGLDLPMFDAYERAARNGTFRWMHEEFCIVSDFPKTINVDAQNRPHCENGPSHEWRDGWKLYHWHGVSVPSHWIEDKESLQPQEVLAHENVEQRAAGCAIVGMHRMLDSLEHTIIDSSLDEEIGDLIEIKMPNLPESELYLKFSCPRNGEMMEAVNKRELEVPNLHHAHAWHANVPAKLYTKPQQRS